MKKHASRRTDPVASAWERIDARLGAKSSLAPPLADGSQLDGAFEHVFEFALPAAVRAAYDRHDGEGSKGRVCPPLRLASAGEALDFATALIGQSRPDAAVVAYQRLAPQFARSMKAQGLHSSSEDAALWTLALGKPGHRIAVDCKAEWVLEEAADGSVTKLADDFASWLTRLAVSDGPVNPATKRASAGSAGGAPKGAATAQSKPVDKSHAALLKSLGPPVRYRDVDAKTAARLAQLHTWFGKLAAQDGVASYGDQLLWTCDPADFTDLAATWTKHGRWLERFVTSPDGKSRPGLEAHVIARSAFGHAYLLTRDQGLWRADPDDGVVRSQGTVSRDGTAHLADELVKLTDRSYTAIVLGSVTELRAAAKKHGTLAWNEAYFWNTKKAHHTDCAKRDLLEGTRRSLGVKPV